MDDDTRSKDLTLPEDEPWMSHGFISKIAAQVSLPYRRPKDGVKEIERRNGSLVVRYVSGADCLPYGKYPRLFEMYEPLIDYLNQSIPQAGLRLEASRNYAEFEKKYARASRPLFFPILIKLCSPSVAVIVSLPKWGMTTSLSASSWCAVIAASGR